MLGAKWIKSSKRTRAQNKYFVLRIRIYSSSGKKSRQSDAVPLAPAHMPTARIPPWTFRLGKPLNGGIFLGVCYALLVIYFLSRGWPPNIPPKLSPVQVIYSTFDHPAWIGCIRKTGRQAIDQLLLSNCQPTFTRHTHSFIFTTLQLPAHPPVRKTFLLAISSSIAGRQSCRPQYPFRDAFSAARGR